jgi:hypothetical protein
MRLTIPSLAFLATVLAVTPGHAAEDYLRPAAYAQLAFGGNGNKPIGDFRLGLRIEVTDRFYDAVTGSGRHAVNSHSGVFRSRMERQTPALLQWELSPQALRGSAAGVDFISVALTGEAHETTDSLFAGGERDRGDRVRDGVMIAVTATVATVALVAYAIDRIFDDVFSDWDPFDDGSGGGGPHDSDGGDSGEPCTLGVAGVCL